MLTVFLFLNVNLQAPVVFQVSTSQTLQVSEFSNFQLGSSISLLGAEQTGTAARLRERTLFRGNVFAESLICARWCRSQRFLSRLS